MTIPANPASPADPQALALSALGWIVADDDRAGRFLALTGLTPDLLRAGLGYRGTHVAVIDFLCAHEPDLVAAADSLGVKPEALAAAGKALQA
ncbi:DUF3572 domain-containing protein [Novosphingobium colocasiae]|uniref:DUF3572 family protein n=1 Tax=Novosphingobium colocasiae TaxID=1256513 RepID=A0A918P9N3_9SPHN|nr:DUF3572 domain-containing protein [Novosphingobium colocasiae]GGY92963.1 hypothetical protein GCM10011614_04780 [Novosphingobium colocasiae]